MRDAYDRDWSLGWLLFALPYWALCFVSWYFPPWGLLCVGLNLALAGPGIYALLRKTPPAQPDERGR